MLNEVAYCPRLFYLEHVLGEFVHSHDTLDGARVHRRVDEPKALTTEALETTGVITSLKLASERLGIVGVIDVVEQLSDEMIPVDYKRGRPPNNPERSWEPERIQVCLQAMLLEEAGYRVPYGILYFAAAKTRVTVELSPALRERALDAIRLARRLSETTTIPPPLRDSPKCPRCSLVGVCLPDETNALKNADALAPRPLIPLQDDALPLYAITPGASITKRDELFVVRKDDEELDRARIGEITQISLVGAVHMTEPAFRAALDADIPIFHFSFGGWLSGMTIPTGGHNVVGRLAQYRTHADEGCALAIARRIVEGKVRNQRTLVRRSLGKDAADTLKRLAWIVSRIPLVRDRDRLLGYEGLAGRLYFEAFARMVKPGLEFAFAGRNRRPPRDPVNAALSFCYALLVKETTAALYSVGLDPTIGVFHAIRPGRPALALDLAEEFRPIVADSVVLSAFNTGEVVDADFQVSSLGVALRPQAKRTIVATFERRMGQTIEHPIFGYKISYRRIIHVQARLLARTFVGDIEDYPPMTTR
jgi:CRISPR-associated protein Cas1